MMIKKHSFSNDKLNRKEEIENLSHLIQSTKEPCTLAINGNWGAGKTTFIQLWKAYLEKEYQIKSIYFNAWEDDYSKEPLISILGEINNYITNNFKNQNDIKNKFDTVKEIGGRHTKKRIYQELSNTPDSWCHRY